MSKSKPQVLSEFRVTLARVAKGEPATPPPPKNKGLRTKLGGAPNWLQDDATPVCKACGDAMTFVAQIDSVEHISRNNPFGFDKVPPENAKWMFGDVGMIFVFYCFRCGECGCVTQGY